ncbi:MAG: VWA domain-containing protein, partial [Roseiflexaceae bacterium]|nr:VWA domain-containing protein [Roseiflexaceae bacterium]
RLRRHLPFALFLLALTSLMLALTRPIAIVSVPANQTTIILSMDVSRSMRAADIPPSRLEAAKAAAQSFIQNQKANTQIGIVAFAGFSEMVQPPTSDQEALLTAIESLTTGRGTAIGSGILKSLDVIAEIDPNVAPSTSNSSTGPEIIPVPQGAYVPDIIVVLTDGVSTTGPEPLDAAQQAVDRGVRVYTIGFGTESGAGGIDPGQQFGGGGGGFGGGGFGGFRRGIDEETLKQIAAMTGGEYYSAESANELQTVLENLPTYLITKHEIQELTVALTALGALLAILAIVLSLLWHPLP